MYWHSGALLIEDYLRPRSSDTEQPNALEIDALAVEVLEHFDDWTDVETVVTSLAEYDVASVRQAVTLLAEIGLLHAPDNSERETRLEQEWRHWSEEARYFHFATKDAVYIGLDDDLEHDHQAELRAEDGPPPPIFKVCDDLPRVWLPRAFRRLDQPFADVLTQRRTHREFTSEPVDLRSLSTVLFYSFAPMHFIDAGDLGTLFMRTSPSAGARQELECYVAALNVQGLDPGLYHYSARDHALELVAGGVSRSSVARLCFEQPMCTDAAFVCFVTAVVGRTMYKYRHPRSYRLLLLNAGHLAQTFVLSCTALGLGPFQTAAFRDSEVEQALGTDGFDEVALYVMGAGRPSISIDSLPESRSYARA
jgi:SagB-type dehydrogenase family enzyme